MGASGSNRVRIVEVADGDAVRTVALEAMPSAAASPG